MTHQAIIYLFIILNYFLGVIVDINEKRRLNKSDNLIQKKPHSLKFSQNRGVRLFNSLFGNVRVLYDSINEGSFAHVQDLLTPYLLVRPLTLQYVIHTLELLLVGFQKYDSQ